jgi:hypothetical protein
MNIATIDIRDKRILLYVIDKIDSVFKATLTIQSYLQNMTKTFVTVYVLIDHFVDLNPIACGTAGNRIQKE